jgi:hypothetical protein
MLAGSWRRSSPALDCSAAELEEITPLLLKSGAAALAWRRVHRSELQGVPAADELHQAYRLNTLHNVIKGRIIERAFTLLRSVEVEPILVKGWAAARLYPEQGLRPYGDIDLCVRPAQFADAQTALKSLPDIQYEVDLHCGFAKFGGGRVQTIYERSCLVSLGETEVRVLCAEDHLRFLSVHMLREGAWRPLWLCDIAVALESRSGDFDWERCLTENRRLAGWVICAVRLAQQLLGADIKQTPATKKTKQLPRWLVSTILKEWESQFPSMSERHRAPMADYLHHPANILKGLRHRWPNPIEATINMRAPFNGLPRLPLQFGNCVTRTAKFAARLPKLLREE